MRSDDPRLTDRVTDRTDQPDAIVVARSSEGFRLSCHLFEERPEETILVVPPGFDSELADELENRGVTLLRADLYDGSFRWHQVLPRLRRKDIGRILVEGGSMLAGSLLESSVVNEGHCFYSGKIFGNGIPSVKTGSGVVSVDAVPEGTLMHHRRFGNDLYVNRVFEDSLVGTELESIDFTTFDHSVKPGVD